MNGPVLSITGVQSVENFAFFRFPPRLPAQQKRGGNTEVFPPFPCHPRSMRVSAPREGTQAGEHFAAETSCGAGQGETHPCLSVRKSSCAHGQGSSNALSGFTAARLRRTSSGRQIFSITNRPEKLEKGTKSRLPGTGTRNAPRNLIFPIHSPRVLRRTAAGVTLACINLRQERRHARHTLSRLCARPFARLHPRTLSPVHADHVRRRGAAH